MAASPEAPPSEVIHKELWMGTTGKEQHSCHGRSPWWLVIEVSTVRLVAQEVAPRREHAGWSGLPEKWHQGAVMGGNGSCGENVNWTGLWHRTCLTFRDRFAYRFPYCKGATHVSDHSHAGIGGWS